MRFKLSASSAESANRPKPLDRIKKEEPCKGDIADCFALAGLYLKHILILSLTYMRSGSAIGNIGLIHTINIIDQRPLFRAAF
jgi:hypothetical protein